MNAPTKTFRAVSVQPGLIGCCKAVKAQAETRYLCQDAPRLPLPECGQPERCKCKYRHWDDRRQGDRRGMASGIADMYHAGSERRRGADRRRR